MIEVKNIEKEIVTVQGLKKIGLKNISFKIETEKITSIIGPSEACKSSLLKIISSLESPTSGEIINKSNNKIIYLPGGPSSYPWLNVSDNISFGSHNISSEEIKRLVHLVGLDGYEKFFPNNKSLGFRFRISLARSLAFKPAIILLDNPFNLMDDVTKEEIYSLIKEINSKEKVTFLLATSNISEALLLSDYIYLLKYDGAECILNGKVNNLTGKDSDSRNVILKQHITALLEKVNLKDLSKISF